jgi:GPH family glycoside/pentoside/hexuronide:cation symporter
MVTGLGLILATLLLRFANFPKGVDPSQVSDAVTARLAILYVPSILFLWLSMVAVISTYKVSRSDHEKALQDLSDKAAGQALISTH